MRAALRYFASPHFPDAVAEVLLLHIATTELCIPQYPNFQYAEIDYSAPQIPGVTLREGFKARYLFILV